MKPNRKFIKMFCTEKFLPIFLALCFLASVSCELETGPSIPTNINICDLASQEDEQRTYKRDDYFPKRYSRDFSRDLGADISPTDDDYDLARKVSRSVFELEFRTKNSDLPAGIGSGWLIAPRYVVTAAHAVAERRRCDATTMYEEREKDVIARVHTFDGDTIDAEVVWFDKKCYAIDTDLALLKLEREINAVPMKIADRRPGRNEMLMAMGYGSTSRGLGAWTVTSGPALELRSGDHAFGMSGRRVHQWVPTASGMSGGPVFNREGEVVSIVSTGEKSPTNPNDRFGIRSFQMPASPPENLWVYGFVQIRSSDYNFGPNPAELKDLYNKDPGLSEPANAGDYGNNNEWERARHPLGDHYSPFPIDQFDRMNEVYKETREGAVTIRTMEGGHGSGFIYDDSTVITVGHLAAEVGLKAEIKTIDGRRHTAMVSKTQEDDSCDIAVIKTVTPGALRGYTKLAIGDSSSLKCGDPLVQIGSGNFYNTVGELQGLGAVYMRTEKYTSQFLSRSLSAGMSGGPVVDRDGNVVTVSAFGFAGRRDEWGKPGPLYIHTRLPVYWDQDGAIGLNSETMKKFIEQSNFYCSPQVPLRVD